MRKKKNSTLAENKEIRATFIVNEDLFGTIKALAYWERKNIKDIVNIAFKMYIENKDKNFVDTATEEYKKNN